MSPRTRAQQQFESTSEQVEVGDADTMSKLARQVGLPLCGRRGGSPFCTRAAGHHEGGGHGAHGSHPSTKHVSVGIDGIAKKVW